jgi:hypothetical protein
LGILGGHSQDCFLVIGIRGPDIALPVDGEAMGMGEETGAEAPEKLALRAEFQDRRVGIAAVEASEFYPTWSVSSRLYLVMLMFLE